jgi:uncharacterized protein
MISNLSLRQVENLTYTGTAMSTEATSPAAEKPVLPVLSVHERRVLGVLVEKAKTTPDSYPLSLNALTTGANQKSNRDPLLDLNDLDVEEALTSCQKRLLVFKITGGRVERWKHNLYEAWNLTKIEIAAIGELLLRGPQTEGELRSRASRMEPIDDLETMRATLKGLAARGLVVYLTPEGRRGTVVTHGFHAPNELQGLRATQPAEAANDTEEVRTLPQTAKAEPQASKLAALENEVGVLRAQISDLQRIVADLAAQLNSLRQSLGA